MNKNINKLYDRIQTAKATSQKVVASAEEKLQVALNRVFELDADLNETIQQMDNSSDYMSDEYGEISTWLRFEIPKHYEKYTEQLEHWIQETYCYHYDKQYDALTSFQGECIIVNDEGDIFLGHKCIINNDDYRGRQEGCALIEEYMEKEGYFPPVLHQDRYGNLSVVDTRPATKQA